MIAAGCKQVAAFDPYWERSGRTYQDEDGARGHDPALRVRDDRAVALYSAGRAFANRVWVMVSISLY
jgi:hypothetical protein